MPGTPSHLDVTPGFYFFWRWQWCLSRLVSICGIDALSPRLLLHQINVFLQTIFSAWGWRFIPQTIFRQGWRCFPPLDMGLTLFPPRHGVDAVSPQTRGWRCFPQTRGWRRIPQTVFSTWGWRFIPHNILCIGSTLYPLTALASGSPIVGLWHLRLATPKEIDKCFYVDVILYLIIKLHILSNLIYFVLSINSGNANWRKNFFS